MKYMLLFSGTEEAIPAELDKELYQKVEQLTPPRVSR